MEVLVIIVPVVLILALMFSEEFWNAYRKRWFDKNMSRKDVTNRLIMSEKRTFNKATNEKDYSISIVHILKNKKRTVSVIFDNYGYSNEERIRATANKIVDAYMALTLADYKTRRKISFKKDFLGYDIVKFGKIEIKIDNDNFYKRFADIICFEDKNIEEIKILMSVDLTNREALLW